MPNRGFVGILLILVVIFVGAIGLSIVLINIRNSSQQSVPSQAPLSNASQQAALQWSIYSNKEFKLSFEYPSGWLTEETVMKTAKNNNWLLVGIKEKQYRQGMGTSWMNVHAVMTSDMTDIPVYGKKTGETNVNGHSAAIWENSSTNQKYIVIPSSTSVYVIQSRISFENTNKDVEQVYLHLLNSIKIEN